ncbi:MAG: hypothetical protein Q7T71_07020, partial [Herbiconiux sp.]|nr:hypothetical protein [Herbiconiux sp.]
MTVPIAGPAFAAPGTLSKWKFDETTQGATAADEAGRNDGTPGPDTGSAAPSPSADLAPVSYTNIRSLAFDGHNY